MEPIQSSNENVEAEMPRSEYNIDIAVSGEPADFTAINVEGCLSSSSVLG
ncbi:hypothetical protein [Burkholderia territorii]|nr:hypothetical protein [Burkholderia territorii]